jgi:hypothetical protein
VADQEYPVDRRNIITILSSLLQALETERMMAGPNHGRSIELRVLLNSENTPTRPYLLTLRELSPEEAEGLQWGNQSETPKL